MAVADPVVVGTRLLPHDLLLLISLSAAQAESMTHCVLVRQCMVVMDPCLIPTFSRSTFTTGARQLVVHEAAVTTWSLEWSYK